MRDIVRRIKINGFGTASASWQVTRLQQLGESDEQVKKWLQEALKASKDEVEKIFSDEAYKQYMDESRGYEVFGKKQLAFHDNNLLHSTIDAMTAQVQNEFENLANSASFAIRDVNGRIHYTPVAVFYRETVDGAIMDIESGAFTYQKVLERTVSSLANSGLRGWVDYDSGWRNRVDVAVRRSVLAGWRQIQGQISEQTAQDLGTDSYEVTVHIGARPSHQEWEGKVWTKQQLIDVCGLGTVTGLHGANCYHDYYPFIPGISERTYTDKQLDQIHADENATKTYKGKEYTTYDALQKQRELETRCRALSEKIDLLEHGDSDPDVVVLHKAKYKATLAEYKQFSDKMDLPMQRQRITQNGLKVDLRGININVEPKKKVDIIRVKNVTLTFKPNTIAEYVTRKGGINRNYYDENGRQYKQISNNNHNNPKDHNYGIHGEHAHDYYYSEDGRIDRPARELTEQEREENKDIL